MRRPANSVQRAMELLPEGADVDHGVLGAAFLAAPYASFVLDWDGRILVCNRRAERLYCGQPDCDPEAMRGQLFAAYSRHSPDEMKQALRDGAAKGLMDVHMSSGHQAARGEATVFRVSLLRSAYFGHRLYLLTQDQLKVTADALASMNARRKEARDSFDRLSQAHLNLNETLLTVETFSRVASHDLRTPINTLTGLLELFPKKFGKNLPEGAFEYLDYMNKAVVQMKELTATFLEHAASTSLEIVAEPISVLSAVTGAQRKLEPEAALSNVSFETQGDDFTVMADPRLFQILLSNIFSNAVKYSDSSRELDLRAVLRPNFGNRGHLEIVDNGIGFKTDQMGDIFRPFFQISGDSEGSGVGLAICAEICKRHRWEISAEPNSDFGTTFRICF